ncbi:hypothetical protein [Metabacillus malikii]|uniref:LIM zinc-binding domain-containing protein n=1 Tax=Metabacillus malikii TaxID=1504265 RepID=A0ABT9ZND7_9BACI|nr:hypothetical protein [Metabacillus malikii]MDQ0233434.1 hypothetical protein [Metabacillus malikii]
MIKQVHCPICHTVFNLHDRVILDTMNTLYHPDCYDYLFEKKDVDTFQAMVEKYDFFHDLLPAH